MNVVRVFLSCKTKTFCNTKCCASFYWMFILTWARLCVARLNIGHSVGNVLRTVTPMLCWCSDDRESSLSSSATCFCARPKLFIPPLTWNCIKNVVQGKCINLHKPRENMSTLCPSLKLPTFICYSFSSFVLRAHCTTTTLNSALLLAAS